jgi:hypothetical protein
MFPWQRALVDLRSRFDSVADTDLRFVVVRGLIPWTNTDITNILQTPDGDYWRDGKPDLGYRLVHYTNGRAIRCVFFGTSGLASVARFIELAKEAGHSIVPISGIETGAKSSELIWIDALTEIALKRLQGSPLIARAFACNNTHEIQHAYSLNNVTSFPENSPEQRNPLEAPLLSWGSYDNPHYVEFPANVFRASVWAIDTILEHSRHRRRTVPTDSPSDSEPSAREPDRPPAKVPSAAPPGGSHFAEGNLTTGKAKAKRSRKRKRTKFDKIKNILEGYRNLYIEQLNSGEDADPFPTLAEIARQNDVHPSTVTRAVREWGKEKWPQIKDYLEMFEAWKTKAGLLDVWKKP